MNHCEYCKEPATHQFRNGIYCCSTNVGKCPEISRRRKQGYIDKYGVENISQLDDIKVKKNNTFHDNYALGSDNRNQLIETKQNTWADKDIKIVNSKRQKTCLDKFGVDNPLKIKSIAEAVSIKNIENSKERMAKGRKTIKEKYGVEYISQIANVHEKQQKYKWKDYITPSGRIVRIQGYENKALDVVYKTHTEHDIIVDRQLLPEIWYDYGGKVRRYYSDIYIPKDNIIIEVKSKWTFSVKKEQHYAKRDACIRCGFRFEFWIFDADNTFIRE